MHCKYCGKEIDEDSIYCKYCGEQISVSYLKEAIDYDFGDVLEDVFGTIYSKDGKQLLKFTNKYLSEYKIREGTEVIGEGAFNRYCLYLNECSIIPNEDRIDNDLVCEDKLMQLKTIILPNSLKEIKGNPFHCYVKIVNTSPHFKIENDLLIQDTRIIAPICALKNCVVPSYIKSIGDSAFYDNFLLKNIVLPEGLESIGDEAFAECSGLTDVIIPNTVKSIGSCSFENCESILSLHFPNSLKLIGDNAFTGCTDLTEITVPEGLKEIGEAMFCDCCNLTKIKFSEGLISIGNSAFQNCSSLTDVRLPESLESIGEHAFDGCEKFIKYGYSLRLPKKLKFIGEGAFYGVEVRFLTLYEEVRSGGEAFDCSYIPRIYLLCSESSRLSMSLEGLAEDLWFLLVYPGSLFWKTDVKAVLENEYVDEDKLYNDNKINEEQYKWLKEYRQVLNENFHEEVDLEMQVALDMVYQYEEEMEDLYTPELTYMELISQACW